MNNLKTVWFTTTSGRVVKYDHALIEDDKVKIFDDVEGKNLIFVMRGECVSHDREESMELRAEKLLSQIAEWSAAIGSNEAVLNRISRAQIAMDAEKEKGFTDDH